MVGLPFVTMFFKNWKIKEIVRENVNLSGKCQGILNQLKCGNPVLDLQFLQYFYSKIQTEWNEEESSSSEMEVADEDEDSGDSGGEGRMEEQEQSESEDEDL